MAQLATWLLVATLASWPVAAFDGTPGEGAMIGPYIEANGIEVAIGPYIEPHGLRLT